MAYPINLPRAAWRRQPQGVPSINWEGTVSRNLIRAYTFFGLEQVYDAANGYKTTNIDGTDKLFGVNSIGRYFTYGTDRISLSGFDASGLTSISKSYTIQVVGEWPASRGDGAISPYYFDAQTGRLVVGHNGTDVIGVYDGSWRSFSYVPFGKGAQSIVITLFDAGVHKLYVNGVFLESSAAGAGINVGGTVRFLFRYSESIFVYAKAELRFNQINFWDRALSAPEAKALSENPWQLFSPAPSRFILIPSAGATTHDVALLLAANTAFAPVGNANFNAGLTLSTLAGALSGKNAQYNTNLTLQTNVSMTLAKAMQALAEIHVGMTVDQQLSATNAAVAAITESIACGHTSMVTANLLAGLSFAISQALTSTTGGTVAAALSLALQSALSPSVTAGWATNALLAATLQSTLTSTLATSAALTLPATLTVTIDGERLTSGDVGLVLSMQAGLTTSATAILGAHVALATQLLATPAAAGSFATALSLANSLSTQFDFGNTISSALSLAMSLSLAEAAAVSLGGQLTLGTVLSEAQSVVAALTANASFPVSLAAPISGSVAMEAGMSLDWTLSFSNEGAFFAITVSLPTGRIVKILASERMVNITASERMVNIPLSNSFTSVN